MNENERYARVFDGGHNISPVFIAMLVMGIFVMAVAPPVGIIIAGVGYLAQHRRRSHYKGQVAQARAKQNQKMVADQVRARRERILAFKSL